MKRTKIFLIIVLAAVSQVFAANSSWPDPKDGEACYKKLCTSYTIPEKRLEAWDQHIHVLIGDSFNRAGVEYTDALRQLCNHTFYLIEVGMGKLFEDGLEDNQKRVRDQLTPWLLKIEQENTANKLHAQAGILVWMIKIHPLKNKTSN